MQLQKDREELIGMLMQIQNTELMARLKEVFADLVPPGQEFTLSETQKRLLDERIEKYDQE